MMGLFDNLVIFPAEDCDGDGIANECERDDDNDGIPDKLDLCLCASLSETVFIDGCDSGVSNALNEKNARFLACLARIDTMP